MISCLALVPRGAAKETPEQQELSAEEINMLVQKQAGMSMEELKETTADDADAAASAGAGGDDSDADMADGGDESKAAEADDEGPLDPKEAQLLKELKMDGYEDEVEGAELFLGGHKLMVHESNADDPYVTVPDHEDFDEEDEEDLTVKQSDVMICVGKTEEEASSVEVYLYEESSGNLYVHHDFNLPTFPLTMCWMDCDPRGGASAPSESSSSSAAAASSSASAVAAAAASADRGSFLAVGTFQTGIEIWNLDVLDVMEPVAIFGGREEPDAAAIAALQAEESAARKGARKGGKKKGKDVISSAMAAKLLGDLKPGSHSDAIMALAWHPSMRTRLASGSADQTVKLWDVTTQQCVSTLDALHSNKVQSLAWNTVEPTILLSGGYDQRICVTDVRTRAGQKGAPANEGVMRFELPADIEQVRWSPHQPFLFAASLENGHVLFFDARQSAARTPLFTVAAHSQACTNISFNAVLPTAFLTASLDRTVKLWELSPSPRLVTQKDVRSVGQIFAASFDVNSPHLAALGGDKAKLAIWDLREDAKARAEWGEEVDGKKGAGARTAAGAAPFSVAQANDSTAPPAAKAAAAAAAHAASAAASSSSSSSSAPAAGAAGGEKSKKQKEKKEKMKTSFRRVRETKGSDED